jgi:hypothetical protein
LSEPCFSSFDSPALPICPNLEKAEPNIHLTHGLEETRVIKRAGIDQFKLYSNYEVKNPRPAGRDPLVRRTSCALPWQTPFACSTHIDWLSRAKLGATGVVPAYINVRLSRGFASVDDRSVAVCLLPGTELAFKDEVRCEIGFVFSRRVGQKAATFRQINRLESNRYHDALEFPDGKIVC